MTDKSDASRLNIRTNPEVLEFLDQIVDIGLYGKTKSEVAKSLISIQIERLIKDGLITINKK